MRRTNCVSPAKARAEGGTSPLYRCCCWADMAALCSWKRSDMRAVAAMDFWTHRDRQPFSRPERALLEKSSMQGVKQPSTRVENIWFWGEGRG